MKEILRLDFENGDYMAVGKTLFPGLYRVTVNVINRANGLTSKGSVYVAGRDAAEDAGFRLLSAAQQYVEWDGEAVI